MWCLIHVVHWLSRGQLSNASNYQLMLNLYSIRKVLSFVYPLKMQDLVTKLYICFLEKSRFKRLRTLQVSPSFCCQTKIYLWEYFNVVKLWQRLNGVEAFSIAPTSKLPKLEIVGKVSFRFWYSIFGE